jgi:arylsulfatase A-like enzyme
MPGQGGRIPTIVTSRRRHLLTAVLATLGVTTALVATGAEAPSPSADQALAAPSRPPNVLVIESDDQTVESMRVMDNVNSLLGDRGATFEQSFVNYSLCCPSRATFLTGQYMHNHGVLGNQPPNGGFSRFQDLHGRNHLAVWLRRAGYYTALIGKYLNGYSNSPRVPFGWADWQAVSPDTQKVYDYTLNDNGTLVHYGTRPADFKQDVLTERAVDLIDRRAPRERPFFLWLTYTAPHGGGPNPNPNPPFNCDGTAKPAPRHAHAFDSQPLPSPPNFNEADVSDKPAAIQSRPLLTAGEIANIQRKYRCRLESILSVDEGVGEIVRALRTNGVLKDTVLVFTADNGFFHGEHRIPSGKTRIYEESIRVPLLMRGPGIPAGVSVDDLVINADLAPTIVDVAGADPGSVMDGRSLIPIANQPGIAQGRELLVEEPGFKAIRTERYMYAEHSSGERELYDLDRDPFELDSRHADPDYALVRAQLASRLQELASCAGSSCYSP